MRWSLLTFLLAGHLAVAAPSTSTLNACKEISKALPKRLFLPLTLNYGSETSEYWSALLHSLKPACVVLPEYAEEVAAAVKILNKYPDVKFTAKSGGHDPNAGHATVKDGVLIALRNIAGTTYDPDTNLAYVKPGGEWNDVISTLDKQGVTAVGGRLGLVGVGGYLLQGGVSFLSPQYGLAADSIVGWQIVAANGSIINVDAATQPDLAVALRGSGSQFGIVTQFTIKAHPIGKVWGGIRIYDSSQKDAVFLALHDFVPSCGDDAKGAIILTNIVSAIKPLSFLIFYFYDGESHPDGGPLSGFLKIPYLISQTGTQSYSELLKSNGAGASLLNSRISFRTFTIPYLKGDPSIYRQISDKMGDLTANYFKNPLHLTAQCSVDFQPLPSVVGKSSHAAGGNAMGLTDQDPDRLILEIQCAWGSSGDDAVLMGISRDLTSWLETKVPQWLAEQGQSLSDAYLPLFMNDASADQNVTGSYKGYSKFKALQAQYDPQGTLRTRTGGFKY